MQERAFKRSSVETRIEEADQDARSITVLLDGIPGAYEQAQLGLKQVMARQTIPLEEFSAAASG